MSGTAAFQHTASGHQQAAACGPGDAAHPAILAGKRAWRMVSLEQPAIQQPGEPLREGLKAQARSLPEMMSDRRLA